MGIRSTYTRLQVDERRAALLAAATELFGTHGYDELSMAKIAKAAGVSKPLLYHYFPTKQKLFEAVASQAAQDILGRVAIDPALPPAQQLSAGLDAFLALVEEHATVYEKLMRSAGIPEVRELIDGVREQTAQTILAGLGAADAPKVRAAVRGWLWLMDGVCLDWIRERDLTRAEVHGLLLGSLLGVLTAAGFDPTPLAAG
ncbi:MAG TPA: TetR family transcriptional regulator [Solirubrobacteraceae bacterium]|nr:TetR family transcriptional regulator [Solirubrobacteraceae bacterium]